MIFFLLRRLSPRARRITGLVLVAAGLAVVAAAAVAAWLLVHGVVLAVIGAVTWATAVVGERRARRDDGRPAVGGEPTRAGKAQAR
ncbi:hypothetical protein [Streptomyces sp. NPDC059063]|uniref:hypothetical protein n=1 Tax=unclassified Streptomyces TaxID=2593676 RepID=UPI0036C6B63E